MPLYLLLFFFLGLFDSRLYILFYCRIVEAITAVTFRFFFLFFFYYLFIDRFVSVYFVIFSYDRFNDAIFIFYTNTLVIDRLQMWLVTWECALVLTKYSFQHHLTLPSEFWFRFIFLFFCFSYFPLIFYFGLLFLIVYIN
jgi:hypothetical protein